MPRGNAPQTKVIYKGESDSFVIFADSEQAIEDWKNDRSIPLAQVLAGFKVFQTHGHGAQGVLDAASNATLENEFGTSNEDDVLIKILEGGEIQNTENAERQGTKNITKGGTVAH